MVFGETSARAAALPIESQSGSTLGGGRESTPLTRGIGVAGAEGVHAIALGLKVFARRLAREIADELAERGRNCRVRQGTFFSASLLLVCSSVHRDGALLRPSR
jgi:hypothetical protein